MKKIIHQVWVQGIDCLPKTFRDNRNKWKKYFPDFECILWDDVSASQMWEDYSLHTEKCYHHATRCDLILARALRDFGGLATGTDSVPVNYQSLRDYIETHPSLLVYINQGPNASNGLQWSSEPNHPFWQQVCDYQLRQNGELLSKLPPNKATGPWCYTDCLKLYDGEINIVPGELAYTKYWKESESWDNPKAFINPGYAKSWVKDELVK